MESDTAYTYIQWRIFTYFIIMFSFLFLSLCVCVCMRTILAISRCILVFPSAVLSKYGTSTMNYIKKLEFTKFNYKFFLQCMTESLFFKMFCYQSIFFCCCRINDNTDLCFHLFIYLKMYPISELYNFFT